MREQGNAKLFLDARLLYAAAERNFSDPGEQAYAACYYPTVIVN